MSELSAADLKDFLLVLDRHIEQPFTLMLTGESAALLAYHVELTAHEIETLNDVHEIQDAIRHTSAELKLSVPMGPKASACAPYAQERRLEKLSIAGIKKLSLLVAEKHDLVLSFVVRGAESDLGFIQEIGKKNRLDFESLVLRFSSEMAHQGEPLNLRLNFLAAIEKLFGEEKSVQASRMLRPRT